jgi:flagellar capping protein FliD
MELHVSNERGIAMKARRLAIAVAALALVLPGSALAATTDTDTVSGTVGSELSVSTNGDRTLSAFSPSTDGTASSTVSISSTAASWTLSIKDPGATTPGQMDKVDCGDSSVLLGGSLASALAWAVPSGNSGSLSGSNATVRAGASVEDVTVNFTQAIGATEDLTSGDCYALSVLWTVA